MDVNDRGEERDLSEREWFDIPYSLEELEAQYQDPATEKYRREHAFYRYWHRRVAEGGRFTRQDLERLLRYPEWIQAIGDVLQQLCSRGGIDQGDLPWLIAAVPIDSYAHEQVSLLALLRDSAVPWEEKLERVLNGRADWARRRAVETLPLEQAERAREIIERSRCGKGTRNQLLRIVHQRVQSAHTTGTSDAVDPGSPAQH
jgi:hypothetical protein